MGNLMNWILKIICLGFFVLMAGCSGAKSLPTGSTATWDLVIIGDSSMWELGEAFASQITRDTGVSVEVHDFALNTLSAGEVLEVLNTGSSSRGALDPLPEAIKEAEVVVMFVNPMDSVLPDDPLNLDGCFGVTLPENCAVTAFSQYEQDIESIWRKIVEIRGRQPIVLRATDIYNPVVKQWVNAGIKDDCDMCWSNMSDANQQAAEELGIPFLSRYDTWNGMNHEEDPREKGFILEDGEHPTPEGAAYTAELLSAMGYEPTNIK